MNWDAIGAIGEVLGAIAVFATLIYLAVQIRQNTLAIKGQSIATATLISQGELQAFMNTSTGDAYHKSLESPESLTTHEITLLDAFNTMFVAGRENDFMQFQLGTMDDRICLGSLWKGQRKPKQARIAVPMTLIVPTAIPIEPWR